MTYHDEELLAELLLQWEELYERGQDSSPEELCRDCPHLIEELRARIAAMKATNWLNNPDCDEDPASACSPQATGKVLNGRYRLDTLIATGGFAEVWRAFDTELQRIVAIKLPKPSRLASSTNFITEARRVARLKHPGIVPVFDVGTEDGRCFIVSEYVEGGSLADRLAKSPPAVSETVQWLGEIATALEYAHLHGVIHRDIKPANILIDHHGRALLADFGIAQSAQKTGTFAPSLGTLRYMSPEQLEGKAATPQSDVYSLGVVLHECLTGELPYSSSDPSVLRKEVVEGTTTFKTATPGSLIDVCKKALRRLPHERHSSSAHFASDLERASVAEPPSIRRHARHAWLAAAVGLVALAMTWLYGYGESRTAKPRDEREAARIQQQANDLINLVVAQAKNWAATGRAIDVLNELSTLQPDLAAKLVSKLGRLRAPYAPLILNGLRELDPETARCLAEYKGNLVLDGLTTLSPASAEALSYHSSGVSLGGLQTLPAEVATILRSTPHIKLPRIPHLAFDNSIGMKLVEIPAGEFRMGAGYGHPSHPKGHPVRITRPFLISSTEVTNSQWKRVMGDVPGDFKDDDLPVTDISWAEAKEFCSRLSDLPGETAVGRVYRLPTEAEWEYVCRAGTSTRHSFGDEDSQIHGYAWLFATSSGRTHPVATKKPNQWGLYDMRGNVWEWVSDWSDASTVNEESVTIDPKGPKLSPAGKRVVRGGCWNDNPDSFRSETLPETRSHYIGLRVVAVIPP